MNEIDAQLALGVELFNRGEFFEAHEAMEDAMNLLDDDTADWDFYLGLLRASVANHKLADGEVVERAAASARRAEIPRALSRPTSRHQAARVPQRAHRRTRASRLASNRGHATAHRDRTRRPMIRFSAEFVTSAFALDGCPRWNRAEVALAGRSNVGKSSLLNALTGVKGLARTSKTPGRTRCLNFFSVNDTLALCDLPGFGYAKMSHEDAAKIASMMQEYIHGRANLAAIAILIDCRRGPQQDELDLAAMAAERGIEVIPVATKCDKLRRSERAAALKRFDAMRVPPIFCSTTSGEGLDDLRRRILAVPHSAAARRAEAP